MNIALLFTSAYIAMIKKYVIICLETEKILNINVVTNGVLKLKEMKIMFEFITSPLLCVVP